MAVKFQVSGGSTPTQFQAQHIIAVNLSAFSVGPTAADNTLNVDTVNGIVSNDSDSAAAVIRVVGENLGASTGAFEVGAGNVQGAGLTATWGGAAITKVELLTNGAWPLNLGYNNAVVVEITTNVGIGIAGAGVTDTLTLGTGDNIKLQDGQAVCWGAGTGGTDFQAANGTTHIMEWYTNSILKLRLDSVGLFQFQGSTSAFPALKRSTTNLQCRLADDSGYAPFDAASYKVAGVAGANFGPGIITNLTVVNGIVTAAS